MSRRRRITRAVLATAVAAGLAVGVVAPVAAVPTAPTTLDDVRLTDEGPSMVGGWTSLRIELDLTDPDGLPDDLTNFETQPFPVAFAAVERPGLVTVPTDLLTPEVHWYQLTRVAGTATAGTWAGEIRVSSVATGTVQVDEVVVTDETGEVTEIEVADGPTVTVGSSAGAPWMYRVLNAPVKVVTGSERWTPTLQLVTRSGSPVAGALTAATPAGVEDVPFWTWDLMYVPAGSADLLSVFSRTSGAAGSLTLPTYGVSETNYVASLAGWGRGDQRYHTVAAVGQLDPPVKWQANARFAASGSTVTATGNAWPAPSIYDAANPRIYLQRLVGRTWRTVATAEVRSNGRFTIVWPNAVPGAGTWVRAYKPGGVEGHRTSAGWTGPAVYVTP